MTNFSIAWKFAEIFIIKSYEAKEILEIANKILQLS